MSKDLAVLSLPVQAGLANFAARAHAPEENRVVIDEVNLFPKGDLDDNQNFDQLARPTTAEVTKADGNELIGYIDVTLMRRTKHDPSRKIIAHEALRFILRCSSSWSSRRS